MTDVSFDQDVLLDQAIEDALETKPPCEVPLYADGAPPCPEAAVWLSVCPGCGFRMAWCEMHRARLLDIPGSGVWAVGCPATRQGGCGRVMPLAAYGWEWIG